MLEYSAYWVWLNSLPKINPRKRYELKEYFGDPKRVWEASGEELKEVPFLTQLQIEQLLNKDFRKSVKEHLEKIYRAGINIITIDDKLYPHYLKNIYDPPVVLYIKGNLENNEKAVAVVGSRKATSYGLSMAESISFDLARCGIVIVSGSARGIDSYAHKGALKAGGRTIAVAGCGLDIIYPSENNELTRMIINSGAVMSEYLPGIPPLAFNFPARNRIISGISLGVVVIEANEHSGSLITADFALEQGREVFAVPGNVNSLNSKGTNKLIKDGAKIVTGVDDILEEFNISNDENNKYSEYKQRTRKMLLASLDDDERKIVEYLLIESMHIDTLAEKCGFSMSDINPLLLMMELKGIVEHMPGNVFKMIK